MWTRPSVRPSVSLLFSVSDWIYCWLSTKLGTSLYLQVFGRPQFRKNGHSDGHNLLQNVNKFLPVCVLKLSRQQNSLKLSWADNYVRRIIESDVSVTNSASIIRVVMMETVSEMSDFINLLMLQSARENYPEISTCHFQISWKILDKFGKENPQVISWWSGSRALLRA
jgi:hypothetical protein